MTPHQPAPNAAPLLPSPFMAPATSVAQPLKEAQRWRLSALAAAAVLSFGFYAGDASALALGRVQVQSALGEPLRAEIDLPQITPTEAESLRVVPASAEVFRVHGLEYSSAAHGIQVQLHRRPNGTMVLRLSSNAPITEPFVDLVIDASWSSGHILRSYTMLFDPPALRRPAATVGTPAQTSPAASPSAPRSAAPRVTATLPAVSAPAVPAVVARPPAPPQPSPAAGGDAAEVKVRAGDTASRIALRHKATDVSLEQMLVAMMRANPQAFIQGNVNRLRAGAVLNMPGSSEAQATPEGEAKQIIAAQSRDFNAFRRKLASAAPKAEVAAADRTASGKVETEVQDRQPTATSPDKLTLSKGAVASHKTEEKLAQDKQADQAAARLAELSKNITELNQLSNAGQTAKSEVPVVAADTPASGATAPAAAEVGTLNGGLNGSAPVVAPQPDAAQENQSGTEPAEAVSDAPSPSLEPIAAPAAEPPAQAQPASAKPQPPAAPAPVAYEEPGVLDFFTENPLVGGGALAALLALLGLGGYRVIQRRRNAAMMDSSFLDSRMGPDSFINASGGQRIDTSSSHLTTGTSSMNFTPSQLDAGGDVDPVAEAEVYLAYDRHDQAIDILREAARHYPDRVAIPAKLAEIYARTANQKGLESAANDVYRITGGQGAEWNRVVELGQDLDPQNPLYQPGGQPMDAALAMAEVGGSGGDSLLSSAGAATGGFASALAAAHSPAADMPSAPGSELPDLDLDLGLHEALSDPDPQPLADLPKVDSDSLLNTDPTPVMASTQAPAQPAIDSMASMDFALDTPDIPSMDAAETLPPPDLDLGSLDNLDSFRVSTPSAVPSAAEAASAPVEIPSLDAELNFHTEPAPLASLPETPSTSPMGLDIPLDFGAGELSLMDSAATPLEQAAKPAQENAQPMDFDLSDLSLDLNSAPAPLEGSAAAAGGSDEAALATKLALAEEFNAIGDSEGARSLVEEVMEEATGELKARAQRLLKTLD